MKTYFTEKKIVPGIKDKKNSAIEWLQSFMHVKPLLLPPALTILE
jgi:hypothetical protein